MLSAEIAAPPHFGFFLFVGGSIVRIGWGDKHVQKRCVYVQFNANDQQQRFDEDWFLALFKHYGPVVSVSLPRFPNKRLKVRLLATAEASD